jgi:hypothetical protein
MSEQHQSPVTRRPYTASGTFTLDVGSTPLGFPVQNGVGGAVWNDTVQGMALSAREERRSVADQAGYFSPQAFLHAGVPFRFTGEGRLRWNLTPPSVPSAESRGGRRIGSSAIQRPSII